MVSTRQMTIGHNGTGECSEGTSSENGPAKFTRHSTSAGSSNNQGQNCKSNTNPLTKINILDLPQEIIEKIFSNLTFKNICQLRFVSKHTINKGFPLKISIY